MIRTPRLLEAGTLASLRTPTLFAIATSEAQRLITAMDVEAYTSTDALDEIDDALLNLVRTLTAVVDKRQNLAWSLSTIERPDEGLTDEESLTILRNIAAA